ncbi:MULTISPECIES: trans-aconitate 2-methyltransferase [Streptacidiphilus]|uniref:Trans-aconitate 2-methyltransferase n=1 Tax=Streptacidiphilus cavernicola TaxID=3342716 RepID=A0ABV6UX68_9ACTN|nr:class I SAM-dependent methyltransferase [Streptacidiphilus jeojiense]
MGTDDRIQVIERVFQGEADEWHQLARRYQTRYDEMLGELVSRVRVPSGARILDLGCGSGVLAEIMLERFPDSQVTLLDLSSNMIAAAERRLERFGSRASFVEGRFEDMPEGPFDAVVSTLALHHLGTDEEKRTQYARILGSLTPGGSFWQGEYVLSSSPEDSELNEDAWADWLRTKDFSEEEVLQLRERVGHNDRPAPLVDQLRWLDELGFTRVDCTWRYIKFAVFGGHAPGRPNS